MSLYEVYRFTDSTESEAQGVVLRVDSSPTSVQPFVVHSFRILPWDACEGTELPDYFAGHYFTTLEEACVYFRERVARMLPY